MLVNETGERYMIDVHPDAELAPRDVVARANYRQIRDGHKPYLDARDAVGAAFPERFPTVFGLANQHGFDPRIDLLPVSPAAHYCMGGIAVDAAGRTSLDGLWAVGEVTSSGVHGANRLASNSLLEGLVMGERVATDIAGDGIDQDYAEAVRWLARGADQGFARSVYTLGKMYTYGLGVTSDKEKAFGLFTRAAELGNPRAQYNLARAYRDGDGVAQDFTRAAQWYRNAAQAGDAPAQAALGQRYAKGEGVPQDTEMALYWTSLAARQRLGRAVAARTEMVQSLSPAVVERVDALVSEFRPRVTTR